MARGLSASPKRFLAFHCLEERSPRSCWTRISNHRGYGISTASILSDGRRNYKVFHSPVDSAHWYEGVTGRLLRR